MQNKNRGAAMVEFALVVPFFFILIYCIVFGALVMHDYNRLNEITRAAARRGAVIETGGITAADKESAMKSFMKTEITNGLILYELKKDNDLEVKADKEVSIGQGDNALKEDAVYIKVAVGMKTKGMPTLFMDYFPESMRTLPTSITMRRED